MKRIYFKSKSEIFFTLLVIICITACKKKDNEVINGETGIVKYVSTLQGTESTYELSHGNTYPVTTLPFGMNFWTDQTKKADGFGIYSYKDDSILGFRQTHEPSPWINDYGAFSLMPVVGKLKINETDRGSRFNHSDEIAFPHYYKVNLTD